MDSLLLDAQMEHSYHMQQQPTMATPRVWTSIAAAGEHALRIADFTLRQTNTNIDEVGDHMEQGAKRMQKKISTLRQTCSRLQAQRCARPED